MVGGLQKAFFGLGTQAVVWIREKPNAAGPQGDLAAERRVCPLRPSQNGNWAMASGALKATQDFSVLLKVRWVLQ